ncbi:MULTISPECIES: phosphate signaling complex protein PhoU [Stappiaceae]|jgi:phosphate transport system protein|uniref:Phosphate-specific transport system accessory protein PhoU n=2 Tax=Roseibium TaxID=150830 RepID=A0A0M6Y647_9HYPH|nr:MULTISPECIES: phosphate signaling complex protein PhoU [Stappiaceae]MCR9280703.1 phosphate signaling complex protein PhoU [Paracoccaceae bacterium]MEC9405434.1 phosphate signaling complex protein PhoU [Pseudomonadota bacterium]AMN54617.1 PhoU family transcriptional regulator [Labrenzia sp. CP4]AQQ03097.1 phosphate transport system regulatory protein PhoU [Roseibium aggregatum]ERP88412.1 PhoU family transcriptional regulator [Labrenzia sp. C1B10]
MSEHTVSAYDDELTAMAGKVAEMGGIAEKAFADAVSALVSQDLELAKATIKGDVRLDSLYNELEVKLIELIVRRQPMGQDLREITAATRIANDLERVGDLAKNVAKRVIAIDSDLQSKKLAIGVEHMTELALSQLKQVLDAYARKDAEAARRVQEADAEVDAIYTSIFRELLTYMMEDPRVITQCVHLLFCAKNIERIGDHATNIAENVYYMVTGERLPEDRAKVDETGAV